MDRAPIIPQENSSFSFQLREVQRHQMSSSSPESVKVGPSESAGGSIVGWRALVGSGGTHPPPFLWMAGETQRESLGDNEAGSRSMPFPFPLVVRLEPPLESPEEEEEGTHRWCVSAIQHMRRIESKLIDSSMWCYLKHRVIRAPVSHPERRQEGCSKGSNAVGKGFT